MIELTQKQKQAHDTILDWVNENTKPNTQDVMTLGGYAGTGKTTVLSRLTKSIASLNIRTAFVTFTGKASFVLYSKMKEAGNLDYCQYIGTIHSLIYKPIIDQKGVLLGWSRIPKDEFEYDLIIIDEASMVNKRMFLDLLEYYVPILAVGDHGQLPPVSSSSDNFNLMAQPMITLEDIHRQAKGNPIIELSELARNGDYIPLGKYGKTVMNVRYNHPATEMVLNKKPSQEQIILCGMNKTRVRLNALIRERQGITTEMPKKGERLICLKNNRKYGIMNGQIGTLIEKFDISDLLMYTKMKFDFIDEDIEIVSYKKSFGITNHNQVFSDIYELKHQFKKEIPDFQMDDLGIFEYGNVISVHKSQGSSWRFVFLFNERNSFQSDEDYAKWLYTAITRAEHGLIIIN